MTGRPQIALNNKVSGLMGHVWKRCEDATQFAW
jgi:hypothetical protein